MKQKKSCSNCLIGTIITVNSDILCRYKGAVSPDYVCSKHRYSPMPRMANALTYKCYDCENFICESIDQKDMPAFGLCQLFSVRQFDGKLKNSCSKFIKKSNLDVSSAS